MNSVVAGKRAERQWVPETDIWSSIRHTAGLESEWNYILGKPPALGIFKLDRSAEVQLVKVFRCLVQGRQRDFMHGF